MDPVTAAGAIAATPPDLLRMIYSDFAKPGVQQAGKALATIIGLGNTALLPIYWLNERARICIQANLDAYAKKLADVPPEKIVSPAPEIGTPLLEQMMFTQEPTLVDMYATLLAKASNMDEVDAVHPSFVNVVKNISPDEAMFLKEIPFDEVEVPCSAMVVAGPVGPSIIVEQYLFAKKRVVGLKAPRNMSVYVPNLGGLGILQIMAGSMNMKLSAEYFEIAEENKYAAENMKGLLNLPDAPQPTYLNRTILLTNYGILFLTAVGMRKPFN